MSLIAFRGTPFVGLADCSITRYRAESGAGFFADKELLDLPVMQRQQGDVCVDVGAYIGYATRYLLDRGCSVISFEPYADAFACLVHNCPGSDCRNEAVGNGECIELTVDPAEGNLGMRGVRLAHGDHNSACRTTRLDDLALEKCDFVKIDVEGWEPNVLAGMATLMERVRPTILIEVFPDMLQRRGFPVSALFDRLPPHYHRTQVTGDSARYDLLLEPIGRA